MIYLCRDFFRLSGDFFTLCYSCNFGANIGLIFSQQASHIIILHINMFTAMCLAFSNVGNFLIFLFIWESLFLCSFFFVALYKFQKYFSICIRFALLEFSSVFSFYFPSRSIINISSSFQLKILCFSFRSNLIIDL